MARFILNSNFNPFNIENMEETIISSKYKLALSVKELIENSKRERNRSPRPLNAFMLYRKNAVARERSPGSFEKTKAKNTEISKKVGHMWRKEPDEVKNLFNILAKLAKSEHKKKYINYKYTPRKNGKKDKRSKKG